MAYFDSERGEVVVRIVYDGLATAGKTQNLRALHRAFSRRANGDVYVPAETATGRTLYFDWLELSAGRIEDWPLRCQIVTVPGQFAYAARRFRLLREIDGVVLVCESTPRGIEAARVASVFLGRALDACANSRVPIVFQANKQDLPDALAPSEVASRLGLSERRRLVPASAIHGDGVRETLLGTLDLVRERVRDRVRGDRARTLLPVSASAQELYEAMLAQDDAEEGDAMAALDAALRAVNTP